MKSLPEEVYDAAKSDYGNAVRRLTEATLALLPHRVRAEYPTAVAIEALSSDEVTYPTLRLRRVLGPDNVVLARTYWTGTESDNDEATSDRITDASDWATENIDDLLDWLADVNGDEYLAWGTPMRFELTDTGAVWA